MNGKLPRRGETLPPPYEDDYSGGSGQTWREEQQHPIGSGSSESNPAAKWQGWMDALGEDTGELGQSSSLCDAFDAPGSAICCIRMALVQGPLPMAH